MIKTWIAAALSLGFIATPAASEARTAGYSGQPWNWSWQQVEQPRAKAHRHARHRKPRKPAIKERPTPAIAKSKTATAAAPAQVKAEPQTLVTPFGVAIKTLVNLAAISPPLIAFVRRVASECGGATVISGVRSTGTVANTCHRGGHALDYQTPNPKCALAVANKTGGIGHSIDYYGVAAKFGHGMPAHYHVSDYRREMGARFAHGGSHRYGRTRYAHHHKRHRKHRRYARLWRA